MGYTLYQSVPSPGCLLVDAPKRYGPGVPARPTSEPLGSSLRVPGLPPARSVGFVVPALISSCVSVSRALHSPGGAALSPACGSSHPSAPETVGLLVESFATRLAHTPSAAPDSDPGMAARARGVCAGPEASSHSPASSKQSEPERVGFSEAPCPSIECRERGEERILPSKAGGSWVEQRCFRPVTGLGSGVGEEVLWRPWGKRRESFVVSAGSGLGSVECGKLVMALVTHAPCFLVRSLLQRPLAPEVPGFVCSNKCPGAASRCGAAPPP